MDPVQSQLMQGELANLVRVSWILLIPIGVLLVLTLYKMVFLLHSISEFITLARYELTPVMREVRLTADHLETISSKVVSGVTSVERGVEVVRPVVVKGVDVLKTASLGIKLGVGSMVGGIQQSFLRK